jgi:hypothetical protein
MRRKKFLSGSLKYLSRHTHRFLDLQKAEAQAREAQIELALERVRARTMAMQKSDELAEAAQLLYHEFGTLGINTITCGYMFIMKRRIYRPPGQLFRMEHSFPILLTFL